MKKISIQIIFDEQTDYGTLTDAIYIPIEIYDNSTVTEWNELINTKIQERIDNYNSYRLNLINNPISSTAEVLEE